MSEQPRTLHFDPNILSAPLYVAGTRIDTLEEQYGAGDPVKLSSNENPLGPSPKAVTAIKEALPRLARYPPVDPLELRQALAVGEVLGRPG